jgi:N utilization substance protein A
LKGSRVQAVVNELGGERIDIVPWSPDPERFARMALAPARVSRVFFDSDTGAIQAVVDEDQLSLAIGKHGQNVRLASELTGWTIDLFSSREWLDRGGEGPLFAPLEPTEDLVADVELSELKGFPPELVQTLQSAGFQSLRDILDLERADVLAIDQMSDEHVDILMGFLSEVTEENIDEVEGSTAEAEAATEEPAADNAEAKPAEAEAEATESPAESEPTAEAEKTAEDETAAESDTEPEPTPTA